MTLRAAGRLVAAAIFATGSAVQTVAQTEVELRAASSRYRLADLSYTHSSGLVLEVFYVGVPELDQVYYGAGYEFAAGRRTSLVPFVYGVSGPDTRGVAFGTLAAAEGRAWHLLAFVGRFFHTDLSTPDYTFIDGLEVARRIGSLEIDVLVDAYAVEDERGWLAGPLVKYADRYGASGLALRTGDENEVRLIRTLTFADANRREE